MPTGRPKIDPADANRIYAILEGGRWVKGRELAERARVPVRLIRAIAEETGAIISSQAGYKLTKKATRQEIEISIADLRSRAEHINARANRLTEYLYSRAAGRDFQFELEL